MTGVLLGSAVGVILVVLLGIGVNTWARNWHEEILQEVGIVTWSDKKEAEAVQPGQTPERHVIPVSAAPSVRALDSA